MDGEIPAPVRATLHRLAREALAAAARGQPLPEAPDEGLLGEPRALFVSLHQGGMLRGCIGTLRPVDTLGRSVVSMAESASQRDPRFPPVGPEELAALEVEISVLTPFEEVPRREGRLELEAIVPGRDGLYVSGRGSSGLLLPQVAVEYGWDRETFLAHTCQKARLPEDAWKDPDVRVQRFRAEVF